MASPPIRFPCYMGINIPTKEELIANRPEFHDLANYIGKCEVSLKDGFYLQSIYCLHQNKEHIKARMAKLIKNHKSGHAKYCVFPMVQTNLVAYFMMQLMNYISLTNVNH